MTVAREPALRTPLPTIGALVVSLLGALLLAGCGGDGGGDAMGPDPSFQISLSPGSLQVTQGGTGSVQVTVTRTGGFEGNVALSASGLPQGASATFSAQSLLAGVDQSQLQISAGQAGAGTYTITVTAQGGGITRTATLTLTIQEGGGNGGEGGLGLTANPSQLSIQQGGSQEVTIGIQRVAPFAGPVTLSLSGAPAGVTGSFAPNPAGGGEAVLTLAVGQGVTPGSYTLNVQGTGSPQASVAVALTVTAPPAGGSTWYFCAPFPVWVAYQDGGAGAWVQAPGGNGVHTLDLQADRGAVATAVPQDGGGMAVTVHYGTRTEFEQRSARCEDSAPGRVVHGSVAGVQVGEQALVTLGTATTAVSPGANSNFTLTEVPGGTLDLLASRIVTTFDGGVLASKPEQLLLRRGIDAADGSTLPVLDFGTAEAFPPEARSLTVTNLAGGESLATNQGYLMGAGGSRGTATFFQNPFPGDPSQVAIYGIPAARQAPGDLHMLTVVGATTTSARLVTELFTAFGDRTVALGPEAVAPTVSLPATAPYPRPRMTWGIQAEYGRHWLAGFQQSAPPVRAWFAIVTSGFHQGGGTVTFDVEDFTGVPGWDPAWALRGGEAMGWQFAVSGWEGQGGLDSAPAADGSVTRSAWRNGTLVP